MSKPQTSESDKFFPKAKRTVGVASTGGMVGYVATMVATIPFLPQVAVVGIFFLAGAWVSTKMKK